MNNDDTLKEYFKELGEEGVLLLAFQDPNVIQTTHIKKGIRSEFTLTLDSGKITSVQIISYLVLIIQFQTGELRLDIDKDDFLKIEYKE